MSFAMSALVLAFAWAMMTGAFTVPNLLFGGLIGIFASLLLRDRIRSAYLARRCVRIVRLTLLFIYELLLSAIKVALLVLRPDMKNHLHPAIIAFPMTAKSDAEIALLANLITLTPGTLSIDVSEDRRTLFVHVLSLRDKESVILDIQNGFERRVLEVFE